MRYPVALRLRPSGAVMTSVVAAHLAATLAFFHVLAVRRVGFEFGPLVISLTAVQILCVVVLLSSAVLGLRREWAKRSLILVLADDGTILCEAPERAGRYHLDSGAVDFGWAVWLRLRPEGSDAAAVAGARRGGRFLMLLPANLCPADSWRALRIWLRHKAYSR